MAPILALGAFAAGAAGCGSYGDPCLRNTDCDSGFVCVEGACVIDLGDNPSDAAFGDATGASDANRPSTDASDEEGTAPAIDSAGPDATRDAVIDADAADVRASTDSGGGIGDGVDGDVGGDADSGIVRDAEDTTDALDATG